jgi:hypothetical protein
MRNRITVAQLADWKILAVNALKVAACHEYRTRTIHAGQGRLLTVMQIGRGNLNLGTHAADTISAGVPVNVATARAKIAI